VLEPSREACHVRPFLSSSRAIDPVTQAKITAAAHRLAAIRAGGGHDNHFTVTPPGRDDQFLILPFGLHWSGRARAT
jgi:hypothetical protein